MLPIPFKTKCTKTCKRPYCKPHWVRDNKSINKMKFTKAKNVITSIKFSSINLFKPNIPKEPRYCSLRVS